MLGTIIGQAKILIVDDERPNVCLLEQLLEILGCPPAQVRSTTDSSRAVEMFREFRPDLVLLDLHMPAPDGFALLEEFRLICSAEGRRDAVPVLVLTADVSFRVKHRALTAGARDFLTKPFEQPEVILRMRNLLENRFLQRELQDQNGRLEGLVQERTAELKQTLTQLQEAQQSAIKHERLNALGTMAAGVAHDFNNALTLIHGHSELLLAAAQRVRPDEPGPAPERPESKGLRTIMLAARDAASVVSRLQAFYRPDDGTEVRVKTLLEPLIAEAIALTAPRWLDETRARGLTVEVRRDLGELPPLLADPAELREMLTNLIFNAVDALPTGGTITLRARAGENGRGVCLEVADSGTGMSEETRRHCLEPFYTTKGDRGTGLGLSAVYGIIQRHGGSLDVQSAPGRGTCFLIHLPLTPPDKAREPAEGPPAGAPARRQSAAAVAAATGPPPVCTLRILVVDDQPGVCQLLEAQLGQEGHHVETAADGTEALAKFRAEFYDLLVTDLAMPGMNGETLAAAVKEARPQTPVILLTGFAEMLRARIAAGGPSGRANIDLVLNKPATAIDLRHAITQVAGRGWHPLAGERAGPVRRV